VIGHFLSAQPSSLTLNSPGGFATGEIFRTDLTGDGTVGDLINSAGGKGKPGTFMRGVSASGLVSAISNFNSNVAGTLTPAGQALVNAKLFTQAQLVSLGAVVPTIPAPLSNNAGNPMYKDVDTVLTWPIKLKERFTIEPSVGVFNLFNFANFGTLERTAVRWPRLSQRHHRRERPQPQRSPQWSGNRGICSWCAAGDGVWLEDRFLDPDQSAGCFSTAGPDGTSGFYLGVRVTGRKASDGSPLCLRLFAVSS
jgi:hypothetical protein